MTTRTRSRPRRDTYLDLVRQFPLRPLRSDRELNRAVAMVDSLLDRDDLDKGEADYLDVLGDLIERYETEHYLIVPASDADMLRHLIEAKGVSQVQVARATGIVESTISAVLSGARKLSRAHIAKLANYFHVSPAVFAYES